MWLLIRAFNDDVETAWKVGDVVEVRDDNDVEMNGWGRLEGLPRFYRIHVKDVPARSVKEMLEQPDIFIEETNNATIKRIRRYQVRIDRLSEKDKIDIQRDGILYLTKKQVFDVISDNNDQLVGIENE